MKFGHIIPTLFKNSCRDNIIFLINYAKKNPNYNLYLPYTKDKISLKDLDFMNNLIYKNKIFNNIKFISTRRGIYRSMNDAIKVSEDDWLYFSGDTDKIHLNNIKKNIQKIYKINKQNWPILILGETHAGKRIFKGLSKELYESSLWYNTNKLHHQSILYNREIILSYLQRNYFYDETYEVLGDFHLNCKIYNFKYKNIKFFESKDVFCDFDLNGITSKCKLIGYIEMANIKIKVNKNPIFLSLLVSISAFIKRKIYLFFLNLYKSQEYTKNEQYYTPSK